MHLPSIILAAAFGAALLPSAAQAGTVTHSTAVSGGLVSYVADAGEINNVSVFVQNGKLMIADAAPVRAGSGCTLNAFGDAECPLGVATVIVALRDRNDTVVYRAPHHASVIGEDGDDVLLGGLRQTDAGRSIEPVFYQGGAGRDTITYAAADRGVRVDTADFSASGPSTDGRPGIDRETIGRDVEKIIGSSFGDVLFGSAGNDNITGGPGNDELGGGPGDDFFFESQFSPSGADSIHGAEGRDRVSYAGRTNGVNVSLDNVANDGEPGEGDNVRSNIEDITAGDGNDALTGSSVANDLQGFGGVDTLQGLGGNDTLQLGSRSDFAFGGAGNDVIIAGDGEPDHIDCGLDSDTANRDATERFVAGCEKGTVGKLRVAGEGQQLKLSWTHPRDWRELRRIEVRLSDAGVPLGEIVIRPKGERIAAGGGIELRSSSLSRKGKRVAAKLAVRFDADVARRLDAEIEAVDRRGVRQVELERIRLGG